VFANAKNCSETNTKPSLHNKDMQSAQLTIADLLHFLWLTPESGKIDGCAHNSYSCEMVGFRKLRLQGKLWPIFNFLALPAP
jgi:hypothetical protein